MTTAEQPAISRAAAPTGDGRVTVVIASHNRRDVLLANLPRHLSLPEAPPVILVDDASTDGTTEAVEVRFPQVRVIRLERNRGGAARNIALRAAETPYVAFCDDDSWFEPGALARAADLLDEAPSLALVNGHILVGGDDRVDPLCAEMARSPLPRAPGQPGHPLASFIACAAVVRPGALLEAGGFSDRFGVGGEEELLGWDLAAAGWWMSYVPEVVAHHHPPVGGARPGRRRCGIRNTLWTMWLRRPARAAVRRTVADLRRCPLDRHTLLGVADALIGAPWVLRERRVSPPHVERMRRLLEEQQLRSRSRRFV